MKTRTTSLDGVDVCKNILFIYLFKYEALIN